MVLPPKAKVWIKQRLDAVSPVHLKHLSVLVVALVEPRVNAKSSFGLDHPQTCPFPFDRVGMFAMCRSVKSFAARTFKAYVRTLQLPVPPAK
jgi:hypothetical protein